MKKKIKATWKGHRADIPPYKIMRMVGNSDVPAIGPFVFLDHGLPIRHPANDPPRRANGESAHPHRGIATLTYLLRGEALHLDSKGNYARVKTGGVQWMKAGNGIIHDEVINVDSETGDLVVELMQFWINLPSKQKVEPPSYLPLQGDKVPKKELSNNSGWLKVIIGDYENLSSVIPIYTEQFIYHLHLEVDKTFSMETNSRWEYAAYMLSNQATLNDHEFMEGEIVVFETTEGTIQIQNNSNTSLDLILFGGEPYAEPIVAKGPFVMNTEHEISDAYNDFYKGKYGQIDYSLQKIKDLM